MDIGASAKLELVDKFCYLGDMLSVDGDAQRAKMRMVRWMCGIKLKYRFPSKEQRKRLMARFSKHLKIFLRYPKFAVTLSYVHNLRIPKIFLRFL